MNQKKTSALFPDLGFLQILQSRVVAQAVPHHAAPVAHLAMAKDEEEEEGEEIGLGLHVQDSIATSQKLLMFVKFYSISLPEPCSKLFSTHFKATFTRHRSLPPCMSHLFPRASHQPRPAVKNLHEERPGNVFGARFESPLRR